MRGFCWLLRWKVGTGFFYPPIFHIAPSSVTFGDSFPPRGSLRYFAMLRLLLRYFFTVSHTGYANRLPLGVQLSGGQLEIKSKNSFALKVGRTHRGRVG